jgi:uncharacterized membrane protein (DUF485 family)
MLHIQENKSIKEAKKKLYSRRFVAILSIFLYVIRHSGFIIRSFTVPWIGALFVFDFGISYAFFIIFSFFVVAKKKCGGEMENFRSSSGEVERGEMRNVGEVKRWREFI